MVRPLFLKRSYGSTALAVEVTNICENRTYTFKMDGGGKEILYSKKLPIDVELLPKTFHFLTSTMKHDPESTAKLYFTASIQVKNGNSGDINYICSRTGFSIFLQYDKSSH